MSAPRRPVQQVDPALPWDERRWHYRRSLASRVTLLTTLAVGLTVAVLALGAYATVRQQMQSTLDQSLLDRAQAAAQTGALEELTSAYRLPPWALGAADVRIVFIADDRTARPTDDKTPLRLGAPELAVASGDSPHAIRTLVSDGIRYRVATVPAGEGRALVIAQSLEPQDKVLHRLGIVMLIFGIAGVLAAALAGWGVARNGLRPVRRLTSSVERIARTEDLTPLHVEGDDEIARLARAFNAMLTALSASRQRQRRLVADAGHELRTPLTSLRTNIDLLNQADAPGNDAMLPAEARSELLEDVRAQIEELTTLIGDLVELARDEEPTHVIAPVELGEVVERAMTRVRRRAPVLRFTLDAEAWWVVGDSAALERAVTNLLDNAAKWSPQDGTVAITLRGGVLTVDDQGPGIAEEDRPHVFDRFYRSADARAMPGSGLGLSIVRQVAERHSGQVDVAVAPGGGTRLVLRLPGSREEPQH
jgi:two-component system sensor histidine kinase MprB